MKRTFRPRLWHLSALVLASALLMALAREIPKSGGMAGFGLALALVGAASYLGSVYVGARLAGVVSERLIERGRAHPGSTGRAIQMLGYLAYFAITLGAAGFGLAATFAGLILVART